MVKRALLVGINNYSDRNANLRGCVNDIVQMNAMLTRYYGFESANIRMLVDGQATKANIVDKLRWLVNGAFPGDVLVFHYSGHGSLISLRDANGKIIDSQQPVVCTYELNWANPLTFREVGQLLVAPEGVNITSVLDCCHSGHDFRSFNSPILPARFSPKAPDVVYRFLKAPDEIYEPLDRAAPLPPRSLSADTDILMTGCTVIQTSADAYIGGAYHGAFSYCLVQALTEAKYKTNYMSLIARTVQLLRRSGFSQTPQLEGALKLASWPVFGVAGK